VVARDVLGPTLKLDGDSYDNDAAGNGVFTVLTSEAKRAADTLSTVVATLSRVDENGKVWSENDRSEERYGVYTPNSVFEPR
jgi:hypothetical protein